MRVFLLTAMLLGCSGRVTDNASPTAATCAAAVTPTAPPAPVDACLEEFLADGDRVIRTLRRSSETIDGITTVREETTDARGVVKRTVRRTRGATLLFESTEHPLLAPGESLPYTYGEAATFSTTYRYDTAGHLVDKAYDRAMDGTIDAEDIYRYEGAVLREHTQLADGKLVRRETFDPSGNKLSELDSGNYGRRFVYDERGFRLVEEKLDAGVVTERTQWTMRTKEDPLHRITTDGRGATIGEQTWKYDGDRLLSVDGWGIIGGARRENHTEFDAKRREVRLIEKNEEPSCRVYDKTTVYGAGDDDPVQQTTTCDGRPFETLQTTFDASGRKLRIDHAFYGNPRSITQDFREYGYDDCGRLMTFVSSYNGAVIQRQTYGYDALGRLTVTTSEDRTGAKSAATVEYDGAGRVVAMGGRKWTYDDAGRVARVDGDQPSLDRDGPRIVAVRYGYCGIKA